MKNIKYFIISAITAMLFTFTVTANESTPDGVTPANENICESVKGFTPSLFGLCVAFCEAQDHFSEEYPATQDELDNYLASNKRASVIYDNYNKRMKEGDPTMPCVVIQQNECACWTQEEINTYAHIYMSYIDNQNTTRIFTRKDLFSVDGNANGGSDYVCRFRYRDNSGYLQQRVLSINESEAEVCRETIRVKAVELGL